VEIPKTMTDKRVQDLLEHIPVIPNKVMLYKALVNPNNFTETVENFFDLTFLVKDAKLGKASGNSSSYVFIKISDEDKLPYLYKSASVVNEGEGQHVMSHFIFKIDIPTWRVSLMILISST
jgi:hypothetical protein